MNEPHTMKDAASSHFAPIIEGDSPASQLLEDGSALLIDRVQYRGRQLDMFYAPFEHVEANAKIVIVGLTPGRQQALRAIESFRSSRRAGLSVEAALRHAKAHASFAGPMRRNLVRMLDALGVHSLLGLESCEALWTGNAGLAHFTSLIRNPVFLDGANWSGSPNPVSHPTLRHWMEHWTGQELRQVAPMLFIPLGPTVAQGLHHLAQAGMINATRVLHGLPHPSGANAERIACFLGDKAAHLASAKTDGPALNQTRKRLQDQISALTSMASAANEQLTTPLRQATL